MQNGNKKSYWDDKPFTYEYARKVIQKGRSSSNMADILIKCNCKETKEELLRKPRWKLLNMVVDCIVSNKITLLEVLGS